MTSFTLEPDSQHKALLIEVDRAPTRAVRKSLVSVHHYHVACQETGTWSSPSGKSWDSRTSARSVRERRVHLQRDSIWTFTLKPLISLSMHVSDCLMTVQVWIGLLDLELVYSPPNRVFSLPRVYHR